MARLILGARIRRVRADTMIVSVLGLIRRMKTANRNGVAGVGGSI